MKIAVFLLATLLPAQAALAQTNTEAPASATPPRVAGASVALQEKLVPGMAAYTDDVLFGEVWPGPELSPRDRSLTVISVLIATNKPGQLRGHLTRALTNGVTAVEASGVLTHLAIYSGWPNAVSSLEVFDQVFTDQHVDFTALQARLTPLPAPASGSADAATVDEQFGDVAPKFADLTNRFVFGDLWLRSDLSVRDRSLVTLAALAATGDADLMEPYLRRGTEAGLTRAQIAEAMTHLGFYAGWGKATKALAEVGRTLGNG